MDRPVAAVILYTVHVTAPGDPPTPPCSVDMYQSTCTPST
jgi:hypothetical protein